MMSIHKNKFLFLTDFSENALHAFNYFLAFCEKLDVDIEVMHIVSLELEAADIPVISGRTTITKMEVAEEVIGSFVSSGLHTQKDLQNPIETTVKVGSFVSVLKKHLVKHKFSLVALGTRGDNKSMVEKWIGTVSNWVINSANIPILLIPPEASFEGIRQIAFSSDLHESDPYEIWKGLQLIKPYIPIVRWLHYLDHFPKENERIQQLEEYFNERSPGLQLTFHKIDGEKYLEDVELFIEKYKIDLFVMVRYPKSLIERIFTKSHTKEMSNHSHIPLLILKPLV